MTANAFPTLRRTALLLTVLVSMGHSALPDERPDQLPAVEGRGDGAAETIRLPPPTLRGERSLEEALARRRSVREFTDERLSDADVGQLLWAAQGITHDRGSRTAPSAGALYPLELYAATADGLFHYEPQAHRLVRRASRDLRPTIAKAALSQDAVRSAPLLVVMTAVYERTAVKYGDRAARYVHMEAGHSAQNVLLQAAALGLGAVPVGAFDDAALARALTLADEERPLYILPVGRPRD